MLDYAINRFVHLKENIYSYLYTHQSLGAHTNLAMFTAGPTETTAMQVFWSHDGQRPFGNPCPQQCPDCHALKPWAPKRWLETVEHRCKGCKKVIVYKPRLNAAEIQAPGPKGVGGERGAWWRKDL